ncbi:MAG TPA: sulfatase, partial [bacterium]|nr:sulfatase [bacterium]
MNYQRVSLLFLFLLFMLVPLYYAYEYFARVVEQTGVIRPNILLISIDTCQSGAVGAYGNPDVYTPLMDRLSQHGVLFPRGYAPIPTTGPSHATMMTGRSPGTHRVFRNAMPYSGRYVTLATLLRDSGYRTAAFISGYSLTARTSGLDVGFDRYDDTWSETQLERDAADTIAACTDWLESMDNSAYFCFLHLFDPHTPYQSREPYIRMLRHGMKGAVGEDQPALSPEREQAYAEHVKKAREAGDFMVLVKQPMALETDAETLRTHWTAYLSEVSYVDARLTEVVRELQSSGAWQRTAVILTADHGEGFDHDYYYAHGDRLWESAVHVPWIVRFPRDEFGNRIAYAVARHEDIFPTVRSLCNIRLPVVGLEGHDLNHTMQLNLPGMTARWAA